MYWMLPVACGGGLGHRIGAGCRRRDSLVPSTLGGLRSLENRHIRCATAVRTLLIIKAIAMETDIVQVPLLYDTITVLTTLYVGLVEAMVSSVLRRVEL